MNPYILINGEILRLIDNLVASTPYYGFEEYGTLFDVADTILNDATPTGDIERITKLGSD